MGSQHNSTDSFNIKQLLNVQQMAIIETNQTDSVVPSPRKNSTTVSRFPKRKKPSIDGKKIQKEKFNSHEPKELVGKSKLPQTQSSDIELSSAERYKGEGEKSPEFPKTREENTVSSLEFNMQQETEPILREDQTNNIPGTGIKPPTTEKDEVLIDDNNTSPKMASTNPS